MKVATVTLRFDAPGGVETNVHEVTKRLHAAGAEPHVFASDLYDEDRWERRTGYAPVVDGVPVSRFPVYKRLIPGLTLPMWTGLMPALRSSGADIIHAHSHRYGHVLQAAGVARRTGTPLVVSTHYHPADRSEPALQRGLLRTQDHLFGLTAYRIASALVVETDLEADRVAEFAPRRTIRKIPPGVDLEEWSRGRADPLPAGLPDPYILYAGRVASNKGLDVLVRALAALPSAERPSLVIVGRDWGEQGRLEALARSLNLANRVQFLGHLSDRAAYRAVFRRARVFVLPSEWEAFGLVLLEGMAAEVPVVGTAVGGIPEVLEGGRSGRLVPYGDPTALAEAVGALLKDPTARAKLIEEGRRRVRELTWDACAQRHLALYRELTD